MIREKKDLRPGLLLILALAAVAMAAEDIDGEIIKKFEFFSQMDVIENLDLASQLDVLTETSAEPSNEQAKPSVAAQKPSSSDKNQSPVPVKRNP